MFMKVTDIMLSNFQDMLSISRKEKNEYNTQKNAYNPKILHRTLVWGHFDPGLAVRRLTSLIYYRLVVFPCVLVLGE